VLYFNNKKKIICQNTSYILFHRLCNKFWIEINPSSGHHTISSYCTFPAFYLWASSSQLSLKLDYNDNCDLGSHKYNTTEVLYGDMSLHYTYYLFCMMAWRLTDFNLKHAAKPTKRQYKLYFESWFTLYSFLQKLFFKILRNLPSYYF
jgi:hypothetical protein